MFFKNFPGGIYHMLGITVSIHYFEEFFFDCMIKVIIRATYDCSVFGFLGKNVSNF